MAYRNYANSNGFIVTADGTGDFTTIASALTAASSGDTIFIDDGTYTENLTLKDGVTLVSLNGAQVQPSVTIVGKLSFSAAGTTTIANIKLQTNSDYLLSVTGSSASVVYLYNCYISATNNTAIEYTSSSSSSSISLYYCFGNIGTTGITYFSKTSAGTLAFAFCSLNNSGGSTTASTSSAGGLEIFRCGVSIPITTSGTASFGCRYNAFTSTNTTAATIGGSGTNLLEFCEFTTGTASAVSVGGTAFLQQSYINSSNTNAVTGAGTLTYGNLSLPTSRVINTTTQAGMNSGTFTPSLTFGGGSTGITYTTRTGVYTRIDNLCYIAVSITLSNKGSSTGTAALSGLPFAASTVVDNTDYWMTMAGGTPAAGSTAFFAYISSSGSSIGLGYITGATAGAGNLNDTHFANTTTIRFNGVYNI